MIEELTVEEFAMTVERCTLSVDVVTVQFTGVSG